MKRLSLIFALFIGSMSHATDVVTVVDENNQAVAGATVLIGFEAGKDFPGNTLTTGDNGTANLPGEFKASLPLTVSAPGFVTTTLPVTNPGMMTIHISHQEAPNYLEVKGTTTGYGHLTDNGLVHFGMVIPAMAKTQLLSFDMGSILSPQVDVLDIVGMKVSIPSNVALPQQTVTYFFPIDMNKPDFRAYVRNPGQYNMSVIHGSFPLKKVADDFKSGRSIFEMVNSFTFIEGSQTPVGVNGNVAGVNLAVNQTPFNSSVSVRAPSFANNLVMLSLALEDHNGLLSATDLKRLNPGQSMNLKASPATSSVLSMLVNNTPKKRDVLRDMFAPLDIGGDVLEPMVMQNFNQLTFALVPSAGGAAPQFIDMINPPTLKGDLLAANVPAMPAGLAAVGTYMVLAEIETIPVGKISVEKRTRLWEVWSPAWLPQVELPKIAITRKAKRIYRWDVMYLAAPRSLFSGKPSPNGVDLNAVTHVTRNTIEI